ncbi:MAG: PASTA domain-containing protein [Clostridia bacterium]|nr:PASTA domain-containing protein [Clostridia bacterium]
MAIKYTSIINSFVSTEGGGGFMTNYVYYTVLVVYTDGTREIAEGRLNQIEHLLRYVRTPMDEMDEMRETVNNLRAELNSKYACVIDSLFPIPGILGMNEVEAFDCLTAAGLVPEPEIVYPESTPKNGIVREFSRGRNLKTVNVRIVHDIPAVTGKPLEEALDVLNKAGFTADVERRTVSGTEDGIVIACERKDETRLHATLTVSKEIPDVKGLPVEEAKQCLTEAGYTVAVREEMSTDSPGVVSAWSEVSDDRIVLTVNVVKTNWSSAVEVEWTELMGSGGDTYQASAVFNNQTHELMIHLSYRIDAKAPHRITGYECRETGYYTELPEYLWGSMEPKTNGRFTVTIPFTKHGEQRPEKLTVLLNTQFGFLSKTETVTLTFRIKW